MDRRTRMLRLDRESPPESESPERALIVRSRGEVCRVDPEASRLLCPGFANELVGREAAERLEAAGVVVSIQEQLEVRPELVMAVVVVAPGRILERAVHPLNLSVCPRVPRLGQAMLDAAL